MSELVGAPSLSFGKDRFLLCHFLSIAECELQMQLLTSAFESLMKRVALPHQLLV